MDAILDVLKSLNIDPALYGPALVLGVLLRYARASFAWMGTGHTYVAGILLGALGAVLKMAEGDWRAVVTTGLSLAAVVLIEQKIFQGLAESGKLPTWLAPRDNEFVKGGPTVKVSVPAPPAAPTEGGTPDAQPNP